MSLSKIVKILPILAMLFCFQSFVAPTPVFEEVVLEEPTDEWKLLGITTVKEQVDRDEVIIGGKKGMFSHLKIKVRNAPLEMKKMFIHYGNGEIQDVWLRPDFAAGTESRAIKLKGDRRFVKKVVFWYKKSRWVGKKPVVALIGK